MARTYEDTELTMIEPRELYEVVSHPPTEGAPLVVMLEGFMDAGAAGRLAAEHMLAALPTREVVRFDVDLLVDYRSRRPMMTYDRDKFTDAVALDLVIHELTDGAGKPFLLLTGPEPDHYWDRFTAAVELAMQELGSDLAVTMHGIPWGAPHTRPLGMTAHASDRSLIAGRPSWIGQIQVPGNVGGLLELRLPEAGIQTAGFSVHVPHYLAAGEFPAGAVALVDAVAAVAGLSLALPDLRSAADANLREIEHLLEESPDNREAISQLEAAYDAATSGNALAGPQLPTPTLRDDEIPDGDALAQEFEAFLRGDADGKSS